ncbi:MAG: hypothetical protein JNN11_05190 [Candidatus Doudnabacteria bacterium]|nr:hypothetical protein [Candidatus Doudnabacteria bacterium]
MNQKQQKILTVSLVSAVAVGSLQALIYVINLNQVKTFLLLAFAVWVYLWVKVTLLYDLHFKESGALRRARVKHGAVSFKILKYLKIFNSALWDRIGHFRRFEMFAKWGNYLLLPGVIFWATVAFLFLYMGKVLPQQLVSGLSSVALAVNFWYVKEIYTRKEDKVALDIFAALSAVKIYSILMLYFSAIALTRYFALEPVLLVMGVFSLTFLVVVQALNQHKFAQLKNLAGAALIAILQSILVYFVYLYWGYNNLTAALFLTAFYNMFWGLFHHSLEGDLNKRLFWEIVLVSMFIAMLAAGSTNFRARLHGI